MKSIKRDLNVFEVVFVKEIARKLENFSINQLKNIHIILPLYGKSDIKILIGDDLRAMNDLNKAIEIEPNNAIFLWRRRNLHSSFRNVKGGFFCLE